MSDRSQKAGTHKLLVVPDLFASELLAGDQGIWPDEAAIARGDLGKLRIDAEEVVKVGRLVQELAGSGLEPLRSALAGEMEVLGVPYDWRHGVAAAAAALDQKLGEQDEETPVSVVGHGLGALGILRLIAEDTQAWQRLRQSGGRAVLLAPPWRGSEAALVFAASRGRLFEMLSMLDKTRSASDLLRVFVAMPGFVELLPEEALEQDWWDRSAIDPLPPTEALAVAMSERQALCDAFESDPSLLVVFGAAAQTLCLRLDDDDEPRPRQEGGGDGWLLRPKDGPWAERAWYAASFHERLLNDRPAVALIADLLRHGKADESHRVAPEEPPVRTPPPLLSTLLPGSLAAELNATDAEPPPELRLRVRVAHGSLDRLPNLPVAVGHYAGDSIAQAEKFLDRCLDGRLTRRHELGAYPGPKNSALFVAAPGSRPPGALIVGLGEVGELTPEILSQGIAKALIQRALRELDQRRDEDREGEAPTLLPFASLLIGTQSGRQFSVRQAMVAITRGTLLAKRALAQAELDTQIEINELTFVELWADVAIAAGHIATSLADEAGVGRLPSEEILSERRLYTLEGARRNRPMTDSWTWWRRLFVTREALADQTTQALRFVVLTERARAEELQALTHGHLVEELMTRAPKAISEVGDGSVVNALYELLLPVAIKESLFDGPDLVLVVDRQAGRYPWELLARRGNELEPLVTRIKIIRQLKTADFRAVMTPARGNHALVIGDPKINSSSSGGGDLGRLEGAEEEARQVAEILDENGYQVTSAIRESGRQILQKLFLHDYRILHIAAHGLYKKGSLDDTGVVIGRGGDGKLTVLSAEVFKQLRAVPEIVFLNCCHLGTLDDDSTRSEMAVSVAQALIGLGARCVVVAGWAVKDKAAHLFARELFRRLLAGETFGDAVHAARIKVWSQFRHTTTWGAYQCYGDPTFKLRQPDGSSREAPTLDFVSPLEMREEIANVTARASSLGSSAESKERLRQELSSIESFFDEEPSWKESGQLLAELAEAWAEVGEFLHAIALYRQALLADDARAPLKAAEQIANLLDRNWDDAVKTETVGELAALELAKGTPLAHLQRVEAWLDWTDSLGETLERKALRGATYKRWAQRVDTRQQTRYLKRSAAAYGRAVQMRRERTGSIPYYQGLNAVGLAWASSHPKDIDRQELDAWMAASRESACAEIEREGANLYNLTAELDIELLTCLIAGNLTVERGRNLAARYLGCNQTVGSPKSWDSVVKQIAFYAQRAQGSRKALKKGLDALLKELET